MADNQGQFKAVPGGTESIFQRALAASRRHLPTRSAYLTVRAAFRRLPVPRAFKYRIAERLFWRFSALRRTATLVDAASRQEILNRLHDWSIDLVPDEAVNLPPGRRVLMVEHRLPTPDRNSSSQRLQWIISIMRQKGWGVTFVSDSPPADYHWVLSDIDAELPAYEKALTDIGVPVIYGFEAALRHFRAEGLSYAIAFLSMPEIVNKYAPYVRANLPSALLVNDTVDLHGLRIGREARTKHDNSELMSKADHFDRIERANIALSDVTVAITPDELDQVRNYDPRPTALVIPNMHAARTSAPPIEQREGLLFIGHYLHAPNEDAMLHLVADILPVIRYELGEVPLTMIGSAITSPIRALGSQSVHPLGYVVDPTPYFDRARVFVAPLRFGAGMKGKIGQSLSLGLPVVTSSIGAEGMGVIDGHELLIADDPEAFARAVVALYTDDELWRSLAGHGAAHIERHFSPAAVAKSIDEMFELTGFGTQAHKMSA